MKTLLKYSFAFVLVAALIWFGTVLADRETLREDVIRLHIVANSDSDEDQALKLQLRDGITGYLQDVMQGLPDAQAAAAWIRENTGELEAVANCILENLGSSAKAAVTFCTEAFDTRAYDTFSLPAGLYQSLRVTIGEGQGKNWWCVVFPTLCVPATVEDFTAVAAGSGFPDSLSGALSQNEGYEVRFFLLDLLGRLENIFRKG